MARTSGSSAETTAPKIRAAALRLFASSGYAAVSMRQIAAEVGVQAGALYNYTPDKQSLLFDLLKSHMDDLLTALQTLPQTGTPDARLEAFVRHHIRFHAARSDAVFISYMELRNLDPDNFAVIEGLRRQYEQALQDILDAGVQTGAFDVPDSRFATLAVIAMLAGLNTWYREGGRLSVDQIEARYCDMILRAVAAKT